jgi:hypothetical protein
MITGVNDTGDKWKQFRNFFCYFVEMLLSCCFMHIMLFYFMFILRCRKADDVFIVLLLVSMTPAVNFVIIGDEILPVSLLPSISNR